MHLPNLLKKVQIILEQGKTEALTQGVSVTEKRRINEV